ncbi:MAG: S8 family serine peptidase [Arenimonas sp.]|nr:S8 family serine peptidase [Rhizobium sp.]MBW8445089.1 S8 family serine peptidase [Arenimonas sp.]
MGIRLLAAALIMGGFYLPCTVTWAQEARKLIVELARSADLLEDLTDSNTLQISAAEAISTALGIPANDVELLTTLPYVIVDAPAGTDLAKLQAIPGVAAVYPDRRHVAFTDQSFQIMGQLDAVANDATGRGLAVAVLDTGADYQVTDLGACPTAGPGCRVIVAFDAAPDDGVLDSTGRHGTNVASIVAKVAPQVSIVAIDVFDGDGAWTSDTIRALDWVAANHAHYHIVAVNLSFGTKDFHAPRCGPSAYDAAFERLGAEGVAIVAAAGNEGVKNGLSEPACHALAIAVGATSDASFPPIQWEYCSNAAIVADRVPCFSNSAPTLNLLAPGHAIKAGGVSQSGTSQAAPHVAGSIAALMSTDPTMTMRQAVARLSTTGRAVTDAANGIATPRISVGAAANRAPEGVSDSGSIFAGGGGLIDVLSNDWDEDPATLELTGVLAPTGCGAVTEFGRVYAFCDANVTGEQHFQYTIRDHYGETGSGKITIQVNDPAGISERVIGTGSMATTVDAAGSPALVWIDTYGAPRVMLERLDSEGNSAGSAFDLSHSRPGVLHHQLAVGSNGRDYGVAWTEFDGSWERIIAAHLDGQIIGTPYNANFDFKASARHPTVAMLAHRAIIGWEESDWPIRRYARAYTANSSPSPTGNVQVLTPYSTSLVSITIPVSTNDYLLVRKGVSISVRRFSWQGTDIWREARTVRNVPEVIAGFDAILLGDGSVAIAWNETERLRRTAIWYARIDANGRFIQAPLKVAAGFNKRGDVGLSGTDAGNVRVIWDDEWGSRYSAVLSAVLDGSGAVGPVEVEYFTTDSNVQGLSSVGGYRLPNDRDLIHWIDGSRTIHVKIRPRLP